MHFIGVVNWCEDSLKHEWATKLSHLLFLLLFFCGRFFFLVSSSLSSCIHHSRRRRRRDSPFSGSEFKMRASARVHAGAYLTFLSRFHLSLFIRCVFHPHRLLLLSCTLIHVFRFGKREPGVCVCVCMSVWALDLDHLLAITWREQLNNLPTSSCLFFRLLDAWYLCARVCFVWHFKVIWYMFNWECISSSWLMLSKIYFLSVCVCVCTSRGDADRKHERTRLRIAE